ncbi:lambda-crystallin homolog [Dermatophagoides farinae]|uniref:Lambda-crystallin-like protein n=1 Tax=Dermatophagoides farinae TaxID=6954 RepID=A0A9D4NTC9_DERFA|nr:lambda-crystallin homolog [Dermatophagoides farinae]KAH7638294.1 lambda-crystallin-like protein [Dermatophagoides farinae]
MSPKIGIVGSGLIGRSWTMIFIAHGFDVHLYDIKEEQVNEAIKGINEKIRKLEQDKCLRGNLSASEQLSHVHKARTIAECLDGAVHVQECVFEDLQLKRKVFHEIDQICSDNVVLCSSTSCFLPSKLFEGLKHNGQMIVGHPVNPPYFVPLVEIVPSKWTNPAVIDRTRALLEKVGQKPVTLKKEIEGFIVNRIQYAILNECYRLIESDVISVQDVDKVMAHGLGMRYAFMGPWETAHLNANGMREYFDKYSKGIHDVSMTFGPVPQMGGPTADLIVKEMAQAIPIDRLDQRRKWRDERLVELATLKQKANK